MNATTVAVDLAKSVFQLAVADATWRIAEQSFVRIKSKAPLRLSVTSRQRKEGR
jgi:hypothetical protein